MSVIFSWSRCSLRSLNANKAWPAGLSLARVGPPFHRRCNLTLVITPGCWIADLDMLFHWIAGPLILVQAFRSIRLNRHPILDSDAFERVTLPLDWRRGRVHKGARPAGLGEAGRPRNFAQIRPFLACVHLKSKLIQNLWNLLEINKIWMEHSVKLNLFPRSWRSECEIMAVNSSAADPWLKPCLRQRRADPLPILFVSSAGDTDWRRIYAAHPCSALPSPLPCTTAASKVRCRPLLLECGLDLSIVYFWAIYAGIMTSGVAWDAKICMGFQLFSAIWVDLQEHELLVGILIRQPCSYLAIFFGN